MTALDLLLYFTLIPILMFLNPNDIPVYTTSVEERFPSLLDRLPTWIQDYNYTSTYYANTQVDDPSTVGDVWDSLLFLPTMNDGVSVSLGYFTKENRHHHDR